MTGGLGPGAEAAVDTSYLPRTLTLTSGPPP
jgi:hypothetical protein